VSAKSTSSRRYLMANDLQLLRKLKNTHELNLVRLEYGLVTMAEKNEQFGVYICKIYCFAI
jgi:hypothetical protein